MQIKVPGKLYIGGEYAIVEPGQSAILVAIDKFVFADINACEFGEIKSTQFPDTSINWTTIDKQIMLQVDDNMDFIAAALKVTFNYFKLQNWRFNPFSLVIDSQLDDASGRKFGLGSSAAVTVATVQAILAFHHRNLTALEIYKLAALAHFKVQGNGSLGDIATSVYSGWISYNSPDRTWLTTQTNDLLDATLVMLEWPELNIQSIPTPLNLELLVGWTGSPAKTQKLLQQVAKYEDNSAYREFLAASNASVAMLLNGLLVNDFDDIKRGIALNREFLQSLSSQTQVEIETPLLRTLIEIAINMGGAAKTSGAGFGDNGFALITPDANREQILDSWQAAGITPLSLQPYISPQMLLESEEE